jgi:hypothetical protein
MKHQSLDGCTGQLDLLDNEVRCGTKLEGFG